MKSDGYVAIDASSVDRQEKRLDWQTHRNLPAREAGLSPCENKDRRYESHSERIYLACKESPSLDLVPARFHITLTYAFGPLVVAIRRCDYQLLKGLMVLFVRL